MNLKITTLLLAGLAITTHAALPIPNNAAANLVLGQPNFTSSASLNPPTASSLAFPRAISIDSNSGKVFVADTGNNRILRYSSTTALANGAAAEYVFGSSRFDDAVAGAFLSGMTTPFGVFVDRASRLWVADTGNHRVLEFDNASLRNDLLPRAGRVFGQPDFNSRAASAALGRMKDPAGVFVDGNDRLWVAVKGNDKVLRFDNVTTKVSGSIEDGSFGLTAPTVLDLYFYNGTLLSGPSSIAVSSAGSLFVADLYTHRVLRFDNAATTPANRIASAVFGQPNLSSAMPATSAVGMNSPSGLFLTPDDTLWVTDATNNRALRFNNASTKVNGATADGVLGQADFTTKTPGLTNRGLSVPGYHPTVDASGNLWEPDAGNSRVLRFSPPTPIVPPIVPPVVVVDKTAPLLVLSTKIPKLVTKPQLLLKGTASDASGIKSVQYRLGKSPLKLATGTTNWSFKLPLKKGLNAVTLTATDTAGNVSVNKVIKIKRK